MYRLDRNVSKAMTVQEADDEMKNYHKFSLEERLRAAYYLISVAYDFPISDPPRIDKTVFKAIARNG